MDEEEKSESFHPQSQLPVRKDHFGLFFKKPTPQPQKQEQPIMNFEHCYSQPQGFCNENSNTNFPMLGLCRQNSETIESVQSDEFLDSNSNSQPCEFSNFESAPLTLPTVKNLRNPELKTVSAETVAQLICANNQEYPYLIIDCRYDYEYDGGHIDGAINIRSPEIIERLFFTHRARLYNPEYLESIKADFEGVFNRLQDTQHMENHIPHNAKAPMIIFHCEFSQKRGPRALSHLRKLDREVNYHSFPYLHYPELYIIEGGYKNFHSQHPNLCVPDGRYIEMVDKSFQAELYKNKEFEKKHWKKKVSPFGCLPQLQKAKTLCELN